MTETERINSTPLGQEVKRIMELVCMTPEPKQIWLIQYLKETAETALTNGWDGQIPASGGLLEVTVYLENSPEQYKELIQQKEMELTEEDWIPAFQEIRGRLEAYLKENPLVCEEVEAKVREFFNLDGTSEETEKPEVLKAEE